MIPKICIDRFGKVSRSVLILGTILVMASVALILATQRNTSPDLVLGGPLFDLDGTEIEGLLLTHDGAQFRIERHPNGYWTLGGATSDFLSQGSVAKLLKELKEANGGRILPGTEPDDRRYEFNGPQALRLTVFTTNGQQQSLAVGIINPVTGYYYASGVGRPGCFPIPETIRHSLVALPASLQLKVLLPRFEREMIQAIDLQYGQEIHPLKHLNNRWWMLQPDKGPGALGALAQSYHQQYDDRRLVHEDQVWLLASDAAVRRLIYEASEVVVTEIPPTRLAQSRLNEWELDPPWRQVTLHGSGINPDSTEASGDQLKIAFGPAHEDLRVPSLRRGNVVMAAIEAVRSLVTPLGDFLDVGAVSFKVSAGDSIRFLREGELIISGYRGAAPKVMGAERQRPLVESWITTFPARETQPRISELSYQGLVRYLITNLDRLETLTVFPPVRDPRILKENERVQIHVENAEGIQKLEMGYLNAEFLAKGSPAAVGTGDSMPPVAIWSAATGQLLQIPGHVLVTMRNHATNMKQKN